jgi:hypothetical protein
MNRRITRVVCRRRGSGPPRTRKAIKTMIRDDDILCETKRRSKQQSSSKDDDDGDSLQNCKLTANRTTHFLVFDYPFCGYTR